MNAKLRHFSAIVLACAILGATGFAQTNPAAPALPPDAVNGLLQVQQQLHETQLAIEQNRQQAETDTRHNAEDLTARLDSLQRIIATQREAEVASAQKTQQWMLVVVTTFGAAVLLILLAMAYLQWRAVSWMADLVARRPAGFALDPGRVPAGMLSGGGVEQSNARLLGMVDHLERRILELKNATRAPLPETISGPNGGSKTRGNHGGEVVRLAEEGQSLLTANEPQQALERFDRALKLQPQNAGILVKKGDALEKLGRTDEAAACYDQAIAADKGLTIAYLRKGGLFNRLARYDEALECYEHALQTQEKADEKHS